MQYPGRTLRSVASALARIVLTCALVAVAFATNARAAEPTIPKELQGIDIDERPGAVLPADVRLRDMAGKDVTLGSYFDGERPVVVLMAYYECPMLCSLVLNGMLKGMKGLEWTAGKEYRVVVVSFDPRDTPEAARQKREAYVGAYGRSVDERGFDFLVGDEAEVRRLADAIGFKYRWDTETKQYAHAAGAFAITPQGKLSRTLYGIEFQNKDLRLALLEASEGKLGAAWGRVLLFCFHYDSSEGEYVLAGRRLMKAFGGLFALVLAGFLVRMWRAEPRPAR
ncbi:SCO family protein [Polyangium aurulentum]|nr:SCO family protein [Polyangium aurulentum]